MGAKEERERIRGVAYGGVALRLGTDTVARSPLTHLPFIPLSYSGLLVGFLMAAV